MAVVINGNGTVTGVSVGGLPDGIVDTDMLAANAVTAAKTTVPGVTQADQWRVTSNFVSNNQILTSNWERHDTHGPGLVGTGMSESSGIFTFPSTGIYKIDFQVVAYRGTAQNIRFINIYITTTTDNSSYGEASVATGSVSNDTDAYSSGFCTHTFDVTDVSTHKCRFFVQSEDDIVWQASTSTNSISAVFTRLGDT